MHTGVDFLLQVPQNLQRTLACFLAGLRCSGRLYFRLRRSSGFRRRRRRFPSNRKAPIRRLCRLFLFIQPQELCKMRILLPDSFRLVASVKPRQRFDFILLFVAHACQELICQQIKDRKSRVDLFLEDAKTREQDARSHMAWSKLQRIVDPSRRPLIVPQHEIRIRARIHRRRTDRFPFRQLGQCVQSVRIRLLLNLGLELLLKSLHFRLLSGDFLHLLFFLQFPACLSHCPRLQFKFFIIISY